MVGSFIFAASLLAYMHTTHTGSTKIEGTFDIHVTSLAAQTETAAASSLPQLSEPAAPAPPVVEDARRSWGRGQHRKQPQKALQVSAQPEQEPLPERSVLAAQVEAVEKGKEVEVEEEKEEDEKKGAEADISKDDGTETSEQEEEFEEEDAAALKEQVGEESSDMAAE
eukprot:evm.model.NODE_28195_length_5053_cov_24.876509.2